MARDHYSSSYSQSHLRLHLCFFLLILLTFAAFSWHMNYEPVVQRVFDQVKLVLLVSPLALLLAVHWLSNKESSRKSSHLIPLSEEESVRRAGGSPWGVGFLLVFLLFMMSYQSYFQERWFPFLSR